MILTIRTDKPESEIGLFRDGKQLSYEVWHAHRALAETLHRKLQQLLKGYDEENLKGIVVFQGPGSFTGLRIGISVANALAYSLKAPVVTASGEEWIQMGAARLLKGENDEIAIPTYGSEAHTTKARK
jgi:tRNA threonylcarbamoyladenosine biosynthesis protein TsaB